MSHDPKVLRKVAAWTGRKREPFSSIQLLYGRRLDERPYITIGTVGRAARFRVESVILLGLERKIDEKNNSRSNAATA